MSIATIGTVFGVGGLRMEHFHWAALRMLPSQISSSALVASRHEEKRNFVLDGSAIVTHIALASLHVSTPRSGGCCSHGHSGPQRRAAAGLEAEVRVGLAVAQNACVCTGVCVCVCACPKGAVLGRALWESLQPLSAPQNTAALPSARSHSYAHYDLTSIGSHLWQYIDDRARARCLPPNPATPLYWTEVTARNPHLALRMQMRDTGPRLQHQIRPRERR